MKFKKIMAGILAAGTALSMAACSSDNDGSGAASDGNQSGASSSADSGNTSTDNANTAGLTHKVHTHRTDRIEDGSLAEMTKAFEEANNCKVEYQGFTDYASDVSTMMSTTDYGDVLMIPDTVQQPCDRLCEGVNKLPTISYTYTRRRPLLPSRGRCCDLSGFRRVGTRT